MKNKKWLIILLTVPILVVFFNYQNNALTTSSYTITSEKLPESFENYKIIQLSDLHNKSFGENQEKLVDQVKQAKPDIIVITGDIIDSRRYNEEPALTLAEEMVQLAPVYYVSGNHEERSGKYDGLREKLIATGVKVLTNETVTITYEEDSFLLTGVEDPVISDATAAEENLQQTFSERDTEQFTILLAHRPELFSLYREYESDLILSGHAHGGQFRIPFLGGVVAPDQGLFPEYTSGIYEMDGSTLLVSHGLGNSIIPFRIFNRPEVVEITLQTN
ncbi:metallophosphoesterase [Jeotgalibacillus terrae]|uniref:Metallophosphoesterase n=1 Tax=Jeotgalibacillus terrae TaxID=587735 RepID=A0ABW5ZJX0_9BACL|nr:metallophosphoesterase [Jeotgalibacillus terrae]MBM7578750.1 putative MPP superfamily phosphohydrolase [Jeotgalibacillus terrae]